MNESAVNVSRGRAPEGLGLGLRGLVLGWSMWLLGSWIVLWAVGGWTLPALRVMVLAGLVGMMGVWPAVRLSQWTQVRRRRGSNEGEVSGDVSGGDWARACVGVGLDWLALNAVFQAVVWPLRLAANWTLGQAVWLTVAVAGWSLLTGLLIAWGRGTNRAAWRSWAMVACVGVVVLEPTLWWLGLPGKGAGLPEMRFSPLQAVWGVSSADTAGQAEAAIAVHGFQIVTVALAAVAGWIVLWILLAIVVWRERDAGGKRA